MIHHNNPQFANQAQNNANNKNSERSGKVIPFTNQDKPKLGVRHKFVPSYEIIPDIVIKPRVIEQIHV
jgi:hypothetical protein